MTANFIIHLITQLYWLEKGPISHAEKSILVIIGVFMIKMHTQMYCMEVGPLSLSKIWAFLKCRVALFYYYSTKYIFQYEKLSSTLPLWDGSKMPVDHTLIFTSLRRSTFWRMSYYLLLLVLLVLQRLTEKGPKRSVSLWTFIYIFMYSGLFVLG